MNDTFSFLMVAIFITGFIYIAIRQIKYTIYIKKSGKASLNKRILLGNYMTSVLLVGLIVSFILNGLVYIQVIQSVLITGYSTGISCLIFLVLVLFSKLVIIPRNHKPNQLPL